MRYIIYSWLCCLAALIFIIIRRKGFLNRAEEITCDVIIVLLVIAALVFEIIFDIQFYNKVGLDW